MITSCPDRFDQTLLTGHLDGELTQADEQRVRIHLEDCSVCRHHYDELSELREATMTTQLDEPRDLQWREGPKGLFSSLSRGFGWIVLMIWAVGTAGFGLWQLIIGPEDLAVKLLVFGGLLGIGLLFVSILVDRVRSARTDPYLEVKK